VNNHDMVSVDVCLEQEYGGTGGGHGSFTRHEQRKVGYSSTKVHSESTVKSFGASVSGSLKGVLPGLPAKFGVSASLSSSVTNSVSDALTMHNYAEKFETVTYKVYADKPSYIYRGYTKVHLVTDGPIVYKGNNYFWSNTPAKKLCQTYTYSRRRASSLDRNNALADTASFDLEDVNFDDFFENATLQGAIQSELLDDTSNQMLLV